MPHSGNAKFYSDNKIPYCNSTMAHCHLTMPYYDIIMFTMTSQYRVTSQYLDVIILACHCSITMLTVTT